VTFWRDRDVHWKDADDIWIPHYADITGIVEGQSVASATLTRHDTQLVGSSAGQSGADATLREWNDIVGSSAGQSAASAHLTRHDTQLVGSSAGQSDADATLHEWNDISGSIAAQSGADATLREWNDIVGSSAGQSAASATLTRHDTQLVGSSAGQSGVDATLKERNEIAGSSAGQSAASATLTRHDTQLVGSSTGQSGVDATLREWNDISGSIAVQSAASAHLTRHDTQLIGSSAGQSGVDATLQEWSEIAGSIVAQSGADATLREWNDIAGSSAGQSAVSATLTRHDTQLVGSSTGQSGVDATLREWNDISGSSTGQSAVSARLTRHNTQLVGSSAGQSAASAHLTRYDTRLVGSSTGQSGADATLREWNDIVGSSAGQSAASAHLTRHDTQLVGSLVTQSGADTDLKGTQKIGGSIAVQSGADATLREWNDIVGSSAGQSAASAHLTRHDTQLVGSSVGQSGADAHLTRYDTQLVSGIEAISGVSAVLGTLEEWNDLVGSSAGQSAASAHLTRYDTQLIGSSAGQSGADADLHEWNDIVGSITAQSAADAYLTVKHWRIFSQYTIVPGDAYAKLDNSNKKYAQTFPVYFRHNAYKLELRLKRTGNPGSLHIEIRENNPNTQEYYPTGDLIASTDFDTSGVDTEAEWVTIYLENPGWLEETLGMYNPGASDEERIPRTYGIILSCSGASDSHYIEWSYGSTEPTLENGRYCYFNGAEWSNNPNVDFLFIQYGYRADLGSAISPESLQMINSDLTCSLTLQNYKPVVPFGRLKYEVTVPIEDTTYNNNAPITLFEVEHVGATATRYLDDFYYRIHIYENPINLGLVFADTEQDLWVWNAFFDTKTLDDITINGVLTLVGPEAPYNFRPLEAREYIAEIAKEGELDYRVEITFDFEEPLNDIVVVITGTRATILSWKPENKIKEILEWRTEILRSYSGVEQRIRLRQTPRQSFRLQFIFDTNKLNTQFDAMLHRWQKRSWIIPIWTEVAIHSGILVEDTMIISVDTKYADFRDNSSVMIWQSNSKFEVVTVESVEEDKLNLKFGIVNNYTGNQYIVPLRVGHMTSKNIKQKFNSPASMIETAFIVSDNTDISGYISERTLEFIAAKSTNDGDGDVSDILPEEGEPTEIWNLTCIVAGGIYVSKFSVVGSISGEMEDATVGHFYNNGKIAFKINAGENDFVVGDNFQTIEVLFQPSYMVETHQEESDGLLEINDFETGVFSLRSTKEYNLVTQNHIFYNDTKKACWELRQLLHWLNGRQRSVLVPTYREDLIQTDSIGAAEKYLFVENIALADNLGVNELRTYVGFYFPDNTLLIRKITTIVAVSDTKEKIEINNSLGRTVNVGDCKICFVDKCRLASDRVEIEWPFAHQNECRPNLVRVV